jgi:hypothetical protein
MATRKVLSEGESIVKASGEALSTIAMAAQEATKVISLAATEAAKVINDRATVDHDLLIELKTRMENLKCDIKELKDGTSNSVDDHERRIFALENSKSKQGVLITVIIALGFIATTLLIYHMFGVKI